MSTCHRFNAFIATLMDRKVDFVCCDNPTATKFTIHILAAVAEHERDAISARTKPALAVAKANGKRLVHHEAKERATASRAEAPPKDCRTWRCPSATSRSAISHCVRPMWPKE